MTRDRIKRELMDHPVPDGGQAEDRSWSVVEAAFEEGGQSRTRSRRSRSTMIVTAVAASAAILGLTLTPAGAAVTDWVRTAVDGSTTPIRERPALTTVPSGGRLLVAAGTGQWVVAEDGSKRFLGDYVSTAWSPGGLFVAVTDGNALSAVSPDGQEQWTVDAPAAVRDPAWAPGCCRVAYRTESEYRVDGEIWVVDGSGNFNRRLAANAAPVAPAWRPARYDLESQSSSNVLAFADLDGRIRVVDVDSGRRIADLDGSGATSIHWLSRDRLLIASQYRVQIADVAKAELETVYAVPEPAGRINAVDALPGRPAAVLLAAGTSRRSEPERTRLVLVGTAPGQSSRPRTVFSGLGRYDGPVFSPDGSLVQLGWRDAGQWLFVPTARDADVIAVDNIPRQFDSGDDASDPLPRIESWCCR